MGLSEYLELLTEQIRCKRARGFIVEELQAHIEDQTESYKRAGMKETEALDKAVREMGDPVEAGTALDRVHRPKTDWRTLAVVTLLTIAGVLLQYLILSNSVFTTGTGISGSFQGFLQNTLIGFGLMVLIGVCGDYTILGKYPLIVWAGYMLLAVLMTNISGGNTAWYIILAIPLFAGIVFYFRNKRYKGVAAAFLWLTVTCLLLIRTVPGALVKVILLFGAGSLIISFAIWKGWYRIGRKVLVYMWGVLVLAAGAILMAVLNFGATYQALRLQVWLNPWKYAEEAGYVTVEARKILNQTVFAGNGAFGNTELLSKDMNMVNDFFFLWILNNFGIIGGVILLVMFGLLFILMLGRIAKQKNQLGALVGLGCMLGLFFPVMLHILVNLTVAPLTSQNLPFFSNSGEMIIIYYGILGVYLSVYRSSNIIREPKSWSRRQINKDRQL